MKKINELILEMASLDELNPIDRYKLHRVAVDDDDFISVDKIVIHLGDAILLGLYAIDSVIGSRKAGAGYIYIYSDQSIKYILKNITNEFIKDELFLKEMVWIDQTKLIYRFTCALKFQIKDKKEKQLRINSWGRVYAESLLENNKYKIFYPRLYSFVENIYRENREIYNELIMQLFNGGNYDMINQLNVKLDVKLLA